MKNIIISEEYLEKYEDDIEFDKSEFDTEQEIEVRIPFKGYYSLKVKCKDPQVAMAEVLKVNKIVGITDLTDTETHIEDIFEEETYALITGKNK